MFEIIIMSIYRIPDKESFPTGVVPIWLTETNFCWAPGNISKVETEKEKPRQGECPTKKQWTKRKQR